MSGYNKILDANVLEDEQLTTIVNNCNVRSRKNWQISHDSDFAISDSPSLWSYNNFSAAETSGRSVAEKDPDATNKKEENHGNECKVNKHTTSGAFLRPINVHNRMTSSSSFMTSSFHSNDQLMSSHDNGPSSEISTPDDNCKTFSLLHLQPPSRRAIRKSSDDEDFEEVSRKEGRLKKVSYDCNCKEKSALV